MNIIPHNVELHNHLGGASNPHILWSLAKQNGIKLKQKDYFTFVDSVDFTKISAKKSNTSMHNRLWDLYKNIEKIQSNALSVEICVKEALSKAYRHWNVKTHELRFDPMARNQSGELDLDYMIQSAIWGVQKAMYEFSDLKAGIILCFHRSRTIEENTVILQKAIKFSRSGVVGVDLAGPYDNRFDINDYVRLFEEAKDHGLGVTIHTGEINNYHDMEVVAKKIKPHRIGHGIHYACYEDLLDILVQNQTYFEVCPTSNILNVVREAELRDFINILRAARAKVTINTDGQEIYRTNIQKELEWISLMFNPDYASECNANALKGSFIK